MAASQVVTCTPGEEKQASEEGSDAFDFNTWIDDNQLHELKEILIALQMTTPSKLNTSSAEFGQLMRDPRVLQKAFLIPVLMDALVQIPAASVHQALAHAHPPPPKIIFLSAEEEAAMARLNECKENVAALSAQCESAQNDLLQRFHLWRSKIDAEFTAIVDALEERRTQAQHVLSELQTEQTDKYASKAAALQATQNRIAQGHQTCYAIMRDATLYSPQRKQQIIAFIDDVLSQETPSSHDLDMGIALDINFDAKQELSAAIHRFAVVSTTLPSPSISNIASMSAIHRTFNYNSDLDANGLIYYLGTTHIDAAAEKWRNPAASHNCNDDDDDDVIVKIESTKLEKGNTAAQFIERKTVRTFKTVKHAKDSFASVEFIGIEIKPNYYTLRHSNTYGFYMRCWSLQGFNATDDTWETIEDHIDDRTFNSRKRVASFPVECEKFYSKFRILMKKENSGCDYGLIGPDWALCCCGFELYGDAIFARQQ